MAGMNTQKIRLANSSHVLMRNCSGPRSTTQGYGIGEELRTRQDVDLQVDEGVVSVAAGTVAKVEANNSQQLILNLGEQAGKFILDLAVVEKYFERVPKTEAVAKRSGRQVNLHEANPLVVAPGAYVKITSYDPNIGSNRGPKSPGMGGYAGLVGLTGQLVTVFGVINGVKTYKVQLEKGGEFVFGDTEFTPVTGVGTQESTDKTYKIQETDNQALMGLGYGLL